MAGSTAVCYLLADPPPERPIEALDRRTRALLGRLPFVGGAVAPRWSPARRRGYGAGLRASVQSLRRQHRALPPIIALRPAGQCPPLADVDDVISFDPAPYRSIPNPRSYFGLEIYYKLEVFNVRGYDRIVYLDCDTLVLDDISALWDMTQYANHDLYAVRETAEMGVHPFRLGKFNLGVMLVNRPLLDERVHRQLLAIANNGESSDFTDQGVVERYLAQESGLNAGELDPAYNTMVLARTHGRWDLFKDRVRILHYVNHLKPWAADHDRDPLFDPGLKQLWEDAYGLGLTRIRTAAPQPQTLGTTRLPRD